jgi:hypothetical protein
MRVVWCRPWEALGLTWDVTTAATRSLRRLISVHGRYSYMRLAQLVYYSFYKNLAFIFVQFWFGFFSGWSGQVRRCRRAPTWCGHQPQSEVILSIWLCLYLCLCQVAYNELVMTFFNVFITALPPFFFAIFERDIEEHWINKVRVRACCYVLYGRQLACLRHSPACAPHSTPSRTMKSGRAYGGTGQRSGRGSGSPCGTLWVRRARSHPVTTPTGPAAAEGGGRGGRGQ